MVMMLVIQEDLKILKVDMEKIQQLIKTQKY